MMYDRGIMAFQKNNLYDSWKLGNNSSYQNHSGKARSAWSCFDTCSFCGSNCCVRAFDCIHTLDKDINKIKGMEKIRKKILAAGEIFGLSTTGMPPNLLGGGEIRA